ncbi:MAG: DapH/DapD/GlmU-related protein [Nitrosomonas ureae]
MWRNFQADLKRYISDPRDRRNIYLLFDQGIWAVFFYRFGRWAHSVRIPLINILLRLMAFILFKWAEITSGISLPASAKIGPGFYIGHFGGIFLHSDAVLGRNCSIGPGVMIGARGLGRKGVPIIGDNVYIGVGAKVLGPIRIGNNVRIGANTVVLTDVPDGATVVGTSSRIVKNT